MKTISKHTDDPSKSIFWIKPKGMNFNHNFYVGKQCRRKKMRRRVTNTISLHKLTNVLLSYICFKLVIHCKNYRYLENVEINI